MASVFSKIVSREIPAFIVAESQNCLAFLDVNPLVEGHTLVIPKREVDYLFDLQDDEYSELLLFAKKVSDGVRNAVPCKRVGVAVIGLEVPHAHIHLVPLNTMSDINFSMPKKSFIKELMASLTERIRDGISQ